MESAAPRRLPWPLGTNRWGPAIYTRGRYGTALLEPPGLRALRRVRGAGRGALVRVSRRRAGGGDGPACGAERRPTGEGTTRLGPTAVAEKPQLAGLASAANAISRHPWRLAVLGRRAARRRAAARRHGLGRAARALYGARRCALCARRTRAAARCLGPHPPILWALRHAHRGEEGRAGARLPRLQVDRLPAGGAGDHGAGS